MGTGPEECPDNTWTDRIHSALLPRTGIATERQRVMTDRQTDRQNNHVTEVVISSKAKTSAETTDI